MFPCVSLISFLCGFKLCFFGSNIFLFIFCLFYLFLIVLLVFSCGPPGDPPGPPGDVDPPVQFTTKSYIVKYGVFI